VKKKKSMKKTKLTINGERKLSVWRERNWQSKRRKPENEENLEESPANDYQK